jgi:hypothetical protein
MDEPLILERTKNIWKTAVKDNKQTYLIMDEYWTHLTTSGRKALQVVLHKLISFLMVTL